MKRINLLINCIYALCLFFTTTAHASIDKKALEENTFCPAPIINTFNPTTGPESTLITINGSNFNDANTVSINGISTTFTIIDDSQITAIIPTGASSSSNISILSNGGCTGNSSSDFTVLESDCTTAEIYISEIYDAFSGSYAIIELYNPTNSPVIIDNTYVILRYGDIGNATPNNTFDQITGTIPPLSTFVIQMGSGSECSPLSVDFYITTGINDNDEFELLKNGVLIDVVNSPNERGYTVIRNADAPIPQTTYDINDWSINSNENCSDLGSHTADPIPDNTPMITHPTSQTICENGTATFLTTEDSGTATFQWKTLNISGNWVNLSNNGTYSGTQTNTLTVANSPATLDGSQYYCEIITTSCTLITNAAQLIIDAPEVDTIANQTVCSEYILPTLTNGNYFTATNGGGTQLNPGASITTSQTIYIYNEIGTAPNNCDNESSFTVAVSGTPNVDTITNQTVCSEYILPTLTNGNYFTATNGGGTQLNPGASITTSQTIYIYNEIGTAPNNCDNESSFTVTVSGTPNVDTITNQTVCAEYVLPTLTNGNYFTATNGNGTQLNSGDAITTSQTIYIYNEIGTAPNNCDNESSFTVTISSTPNVDTLSNQTVCSEYILPALTDGNYFTGTNGTGTPLFDGDTISTSQTIYIYNEVGTAPNNCSNQSSFSVTISSTLNVDTMPDQIACSKYILPELTNGNYFTGTNGTGSPLYANNTISASQTIYIYNEIGTAPNICSNESSFYVTVNDAIDFTLDQSNISISNATLIVTMLDQSIDYNYAVDYSNIQTSNIFSDLSQGSHTLYVTGENSCIIKSLSFEIESELFIPLFFTPNGDRMNDSWTVIDKNNMVEKILIFNRYGKLLKQLIPSNYSWDGFYNGHLLESNDYWYLITLKNSKEIKGHFALKH
ncbi:T9SS type B sorting domain-containing protein [Winogradskyella sp. PAMC22761]|nr:T9SS type B sorting domain-containing protein [Winogradskyella sp. PAMC22761]